MDCARTTPEHLARELNGRGYRYIDLMAHREWALAAVDAFDYAVEHGVTIEPALRREAKRLLLDVPDADAYDAEALTRAITRMDHAAT